MEDIGYDQQQVQQQQEEQQSQEFMMYAHNNQTPNRHEILTESNYNNNNNNLIKEGIENNMEEQYVNALVEQSSYIENNPEQFTINNVFIDETDAIFDDVTEVLYNQNVDPVKKKFGIGKHSKNMKTIANQINNMSENDDSNNTVTDLGIEKNVSTSESQSAILDERKINKKKINDALRKKIFKKTAISAKLTNVNGELNSENNDRSEIKSESTDMNNLYLNDQVQIINNEVTLFCNDIVDLSSESEDSDSDFENNTTLTKNGFAHKPKGRYNKRKIASEISILADSKRRKLAQSNSAQIITNIASSSFDHQYLSQGNNVVNRRFVNHLINRNYYMFIVCQADEREQGNERFKLFYAMAVSSLAERYCKFYNHIDRFVFVVSLEKYRFMISYELVKNMNISIPHSEDFVDDVKRNQTDKCFFNEVKDYEFLNLLVTTFNLDMCVARVNITLMLSAVGSLKSKLILDDVSKMYEDNSLFTLPFDLFSNEINEKDTVEITNSTSLYIKNIIQNSNQVLYKKSTLPVSTGTIHHELRFWLKIKGNKIQEKQNYFTYKYGSVVRLMIDDTCQSYKSLLKIKKDNNGNANVIYEYLEGSKESKNRNNFLLLTTKHDDRISIFKINEDFIWITSDIKDIIAVDIINRFRCGKHHLFSLNKTNRKEINVKHNGMIKLLSFYTSECIDFQKFKHLSTLYFDSSYTCV